MGFKFFQLCVSLNLLNQTGAGLLQGYRLALLPCRGKGHKSFQTHPVPD
jgi:hypothetical protein